MIEGRTRDSATREVVDNRTIDRAAGDRFDSALYDPTRAPVAWLVSWRSAIAGWLAATGTLLGLGLLVFAVGLSQVNLATAVTQGGLPPALARNAAYWTVGLMALAFLVGGFVAAYLADARRPATGARHGLWAFLVACPMLLWLAAYCLGGGIGTLVATVAALHFDPTAASRVDAAGVGDSASFMRELTWGVLAGVVVGCLASLIGGVIATSRYGANNLDHERHLSRHSGSNPLARAAERLEETGRR